MLTKGAFTNHVTRRREGVGRSPTNELRQNRQRKVKKKGEGKEGEPGRREEKSEENEQAEKYCFRHTSHLKYLLLVIGGGVEGWSRVRG